MLYTLHDMYIHLMKVMRGFFPVFSALRTGGGNHFGQVHHALQVPSGQGTSLQPNSHLPSHSALLDIPRQPTCTYEARYWGILSAYTILHVQAYVICLGISNKSECQHSIFTVLLHLHL